MSLDVLKQRCPYCQKWRFPRDIRHMTGGAAICTDCQAQHEAALLALSGLKANGDGTFSTIAPPPRECSECHVTPEELAARGEDSDRWIVIYEGGIYRYFCRPCGRNYVPKRAELFKGTEYGKSRGLCR